ncbi:hypothetical protein P175DRAFT_0504373 [Aspergillus ochraceoroseus IBT 24754]|uniref:TPR domain protein n=2 Tax=Aspergillus ochraceoroseus TaxID=138278 RepID=A0A2T5LQ96_9EURO|nr:uncharacterized protein P175DRAFT_0504373 [Aspergillus ochraceoroseus IBT 24754]KKK16592.1 hypothetical protein AOCH_005096 [Aspergillus ochraceoroseus]PTU18453.1 hypothetical protein P175DRAFT_0504373 [Aspergillus ochraceoroseus IBT 24754]
MFKAVASRRAGYAFVHNPRNTTTTTLFSRPISIATQPRLNRQLPKFKTPQQCSPLPLTSPGLHAATVQTRSLSYARRTKLNLRSASKGIWRNNPLVLPFAIAVAVGAAGILAYVGYLEVTQSGPQFHNFPPPVEKSLRSAVYYTDVKLNPAKALKAYREALHTALEIGMHPFSDEVLGIKLETAHMLEMAGLYKPAIEVLERTRDETLAWIDSSQKQSAQRQAEKAKYAAMEGNANAPGASADKLEINDPQVLDTYRKMKELDEYEEIQRDKAIKKVVGIQLKLAELFGNPLLADGKRAHAAQIAAVETALKELQRRKDLGLPVSGGLEDGSPWLTRVEVAVALTELAHNYIVDDMPELSLPLYLRSLDLLRIEEGNPPSSRQVEVLNGVSTAVGSEALKAVRLNPKITDHAGFANSRKWAMKTLEVAAAVPDWENDQLCIECCAAACSNLGNLSLREDRLDEAEDWYKKAHDLSTKVDYMTGIMLSKKGIENVAEKRKKRE